MLGWTKNRRMTMVDMDFDKSFLESFLTMILQPMKETIMSKNGRMQKSNNLR